MSNHVKQDDDIWLIGAGSMAAGYAKVLIELKKDFITIGRGEASSIKFEHKLGKKVVRRGLTHWIDSNKIATIPGAVIVATPVDVLKSNTLELLNLGVKNILVEKPGALSIEEMQEVVDVSKRLKANVIIGYNRRFYTSTIKALEILSLEDEISSLHFEFTEWGHVIEKLEIKEEILNAWLLCNSSHVIDLAFYLGGEPTHLHAQSEGENMLKWHPRASKFTGIGKTVKNIPFSYNANWNAPGSWEVEILTKNFKLIFRPLEKLKIQKQGGVQVDEMELENQLDRVFKPGLYQQTASFLDGDYKEMLTANDQLVRMKTVYQTILEGNV